MIERAISLTRSFVLGGFALMMLLGCALGLVAILAALAGGPLDWLGVLPAPGTGWRGVVVEAGYSASVWIGGIGSLFFFAFIVEIIVFEPVFTAWERHQARRAPTVHEVILARFVSSLTKGRRR